MLGDGRAGFNEIAGVDIGNAVYVADHGMMNVAADDPVGMMPARGFGQGRLEGADEIHRVLHLEFGPGRKRPVGKPQPAADFVEPEVQPESKCIGPIAQPSKPARVLYNDVELVAMDDEEPFFVSRHVIGMIGDFHAAKHHPDIIARELVVIAGHVNHPGALAHFTQQLLEDIVVRLRPVPSAFEPPPVDYIADEVNCFSVIMSQEIQQKLGLAAARPEMNVGQE